MCNVAKDRPTIAQSQPISKCVNLLFTLLKLFFTFLSFLDYPKVVKVHAVVLHTNDKVAKVAMRTKQTGPGTT